MEKFFEKGYFTVCPPKIKPKADAIFFPVDLSIIEDKNRLFNIFFCWQIRDNNKIINYSYIALKIDLDKKYDFDLIEKVRWIKHNISLLDDYLIFIFDKFITHKEYDTYWKVLEFIYKGSSVCDYIPMWNTVLFPNWNIVEWDINNKTYIDVTKIQLITTFFNRHNNQSIFSQDTSKDNITKIKNELSIIWIESILRKLWITWDSNTFAIQWTDFWKIDISKNMVVDLWDKWHPIWWPFFFVLNHKNLRLEETLEWFNTNYSTSFELNEEDLSIVKGNYINDWVTVINWDWFFKWDSWYIKSWDKPVRLTNFIIKVFYKIEKIDWRKEYIIQLFNYDTNEVSPQIHLINTHSITKFKEFLSWFWWFFFYWNDKEITNVLKSINEIDVPNIKNVLWIWFHWDKLILANWIFNLKTKKLVLWEKWDKFLFDDEWQWYQISTNVGKIFFESFDITSSHCFNTTNKVSSAKLIWECFSNLYKWDVWLLLLMYIYWQIAFWIFKDYNDSIRYPILLTYWLTASGKTEFVKLFSRIYWIWSDLKSFNWLSSFMFLSLISSFQWIPIFLSEYRETWIKDVYQKHSKIRSLYDRSGEWKWRADQTVVNYKYTANLAIEWEETISDAATRSRSIMIHMSKKLKLDDTAKFLELSHSPQVENLLYTYLRWVDFDYTKYTSFFKDWLIGFKTNENRISENFARIYAWCMLFDSSRKDEYLQILNKYFNLNVKDQKEHQWYMAFFKALSENINNIYYYNTLDTPYFVPDNVLNIQYPHFFLRIERIKEHFRIKNVKLELEFDTYLSYMDDAWFEYWLHEVDWYMAQAIKIPITKDIPKELLVIREVYDIYKTMRETWLFAN